MIYAIGDIHGMFEKLYDLYASILTDIEETEDKKNIIIFLGDYVDRGADSRVVLDFLMQLKDTDILTHVCLMGNHECMMINAYNGKNVELYLNNGGDETIKSFGCDLIEQFSNNEDFKKYITWCENLPSIYVNGMYVFVHAGFNPKFSPEMQHKETLLWKRNKSGEYDNCVYTVVHGHTPITDPFIGLKEINVDTGAFIEFNQLTAVRLPLEIWDYTDDELCTMPADTLDTILFKETKILYALERYIVDRPLV